MPSMGFTIERRVTKSLFDDPLIISLLRGEGASGEAG